MGEDADFFDLEGAADPKLLNKLHDLGIDDPELLARLIDGWAGFDLNACLVGLEADRRRLRVELHSLMTQFQQLGQVIAEKAREGAWVDPAELAVADLLHGPGWTDVSDAQEYLALAQRVGTIPVRVNRGEFGGKSALDPATTRIVSAVAHYCDRMQIPFTGEPRAEQTSTGVTYPIKSEAAKLTDAVLKSLAVEIAPKTLATHMKNARAVVETLFPKPAN